MSILAPRATSLVTKHGKRSRPRKYSANSVRPKNRRKLYAYAFDGPLSFKGAVTCEIRANQRVIEAEFLVIRGKGASLMGRAQP